MKNWLIIVFSFFILNQAFGQKEQVGIDIIYLKDGSFLKGQILSANQFGYLFQLFGVSEPLSLSSLIVKKVIENDDSGIYFEDGKRIPTGGMYWSYKFSGAFGRSEFDGHFKGMHFQLSTGKRLSPRLSVGGGTGFDFQAGPDWDNYTFAPVFAEAIALVRKKPFTPYFRLVAGYNIPLQIGQEWQGDSSKYRGGALVQPSLGFRFPTRKKAAFTMELGYKWQNTKATFVSRNWGGEGNVITEQFINFNRLEFSIGSMF